jgi:hypothetical protein
MYSIEHALFYSTQYNTILNMYEYKADGQLLNTGSGTVMRGQKLVVIFCQLSVNIIVCVIQYNSRHKVRVLQDEKKYQKGEL